MTCLSPSRVEPVLNALVIPGSGFRFVAPGLLRAVVRVLFVILAVLLAVPGWSGETRLALLGPRARIDAARVTLDPRDPSRRGVGKLTFLGGAALTSPDPAFGGFSSIAVVGDQFTLLSDGGNLVCFRMSGDWRPRTIWSGSLPAGPGTGWEKRDRDAESLASDGRHWWVGFERANAIWRYDVGFIRAEGWVKPPAMARWPENGGAEALVRRSTGQFVVVSEVRHVARRYWAGSEVARLRTREGLIFAGDPLSHPSPDRFAYVAPGRFDVSDTAEAPGGDLIFLNRRFRLPFRFVSMIARVRASEIRRGGIARPEPLAVLDAPLVHDNFEGVAVTREGNATILWVVSDDNEMILQRTLLLKFRLDG